MNITRSLLENLCALAAGETIAASKLKGKWVNEMLQDGALVAISHGSRVTYKVAAVDYFQKYLAEKYNLRDVKAILDMKLNHDTERSRQVVLSGNSKLLRQRTMRGFLVNGYEPLEVELSGVRQTLRFQPGMLPFIHDYPSFVIPKDVTVIGMENVENFVQIAHQRYLFPNNRLLFVSRYPQSGDLIKWLKTIPNPYIHFGDFDLAGIHIYLSEFYKHLGSRASFLIPTDIATRLQHGSGQRYDAQYDKFKDMVVTDQRVQPLVDLIHRTHKGYDQEGYIQKE